MSIIHYSISVISLAAGLLVTVLPEGAQAAGWTAPLVGGGEVRVDPRTNRATVLRHGVETQLWDGAHRLQDGSTLIIRSGQAVPNTAILRARRMPDIPERPRAEQWIGVPIAGYSPCERLVRRVCGIEQECANEKPCDLAWQLLDMEHQERKRNASPNYMTYSSGQCQEADQDRAFFISCGQTAIPGQLAMPPAQRDESAGHRPPSACNLLVNKVCGLQGACAAETSCDAARQLLHMVQDMSAEQTGPGEDPAEHMCVEALSDEGFFSPCAVPP